ncbi:MAG: hypothetical protein J0G98_18320 [Terrimonas ferruginea]|uniref:hypothetical protein n=1 Tax=Terrimonas ferruginea TaxID=249 RepID=UPI001AC7B7E4|nr:hypothetical protein [Terrimonas ferruginea]
MYLRQNTNPYPDPIKLKIEYLSKLLNAVENREAYNPTSSFIEVYCRLFDDNSFDTFVDLEVSRLKLPASFTRKPELLRDKLNAYDESGLTQQEIIQDPKWMELMQQAKLVIDNWDDAFKGNDL